MFDKSFGSAKFDWAFDLLGLVGAGKGGEVVTLRIFVSKYESIAICITRWSKRPSTEDLHKFRSRSDVIAEW